MVSVEWIGDQAINLVYRVPEGTVAETTLYRDDEHRLSISQAGRAWSFDTDGALLRLTTEANRIKLAHFFDPLSGNPHQPGRSAAAPDLRCLRGDAAAAAAALPADDDPGAGKTIMVGLLIKELIARNDLERCLIVAFGPRQSGRIGPARALLQAGAHVMRPAIRKS